MTFSDPRRTMTNVITKKSTRPVRTLQLYYFSCLFGDASYFSVRDATCHEMWKEKNLLRAHRARQGFHIHPDFSPRPAAKTPRILKVFRVLFSF